MGKTVLHCLSQLPTRTGSGVYYRNLIAELPHHRDVRQVALYGKPLAREIDWLTADAEYPVTFETPDLPYPICGMSDEMPYPSTVFCEMTPDELAIYENAFRTRLQEVREKEQPDLVLCHHLWILCRIVLEVFPDIPVIGISHGTDLRQALQNPELKERYVGDLDGLAAVAALSKLHEEPLAEVFGIAPEKITVTGGAFDQNVFYPPEERITPRPDCANFLYAGKIAEAKGVYEMVEAFDLLTREMPNVHLEIVGRETEETCRRIKDRSNNNPNITFHDVERQEILAEHMRHSDIFILPSYYEGLGLIALEALASGMYLVATELPALIEQLGPEIAEHKAICWAPMPELVNLDQIAPDAVQGHVETLKNCFKRQAEHSLANGAVTGVEELIGRHNWRGLAAKINRLIAKALPAE